MANSSLRKQLLITIIVLMLFVSSAIVWVSIQAGTDAVNNLTQRVMLNMIERIGDDNEHHLNEAIRTLETIAPDSTDFANRPNFPTDVKSLEQRLRFAGDLYKKTTSNVYFAAPNGYLIGLHRVDDEHIDLYVNHTAESQSPKISDQNGRSGWEIYDARLRSWYLNALEHETPVWSDIYNNFADHEPTITLAKAVYQPDHRLAGVVATDVTLKKLSDYLRSINISAHSVSFIVDANGYMIASSTDELPYDVINNQPTRKMAESMTNQLIRQSYLSVVKDKLATSNIPISSSQTFEFNNEKVDVAYAKLGSEFGLKWISVVAVPRADFMGGINHSLFQSLIIMALFIVLALVIGLAVIEHMLRDIRQLTTAAQKIGNGEPLPRLHIHRKDEIGHLVKTFVEMENKLRFDRLTQVNNREFIIAQIEFLERHAIQHPDEKVNFTLLFLDLDKFKAINDSYGHAAGDQLLIVIAARLKAAVRDTDIVARFGGDEFLVLLNGTSNTIDIQSTVDKIHSLVEQPIALSDQIVAVQVSVGWAIFPTEALTYSGLIDIADARMFSSKKEHRDVHLKLVE